MLNKIEELKQEIAALTAANEAELEAIRLKYLSKKVLFRNFSTTFVMFLPSKNAK